MPAKGALATQRPFVLAAQSASTLQLPPLTGRVPGASCMHVGSGRVCGHAVATARWASGTRLVVPALPPVAPPSVPAVPPAPAAAPAIPLWPPTPDPVTPPSTDPAEPAWATAPSTERLLLEPQPMTNAAQNVTHVNRLDRVTSDPTARD